MPLKIKFNYDRLGIVTSVACAIHCTVLPLFVSTMPFWGIDVLGHKAIEWSMIFLALLFGTLSLNHGYKQHHHKLLPLFLFCAGFSFLILNQLITERFVYFLIPASAICIVSAHYLNLLYTHRHKK